MSKKTKRVETQKEVNGLSRREFIKNAGIVAGGAALVGAVGCAPQSTGETASKPWMPAKWNKEADVVIIGSGAGGMAAAIEAADAKTSVIVLEKADKLGGDSFICDGICGGVGTRLAKSKGINVSLDEMYEFTMRFPDNQYDPEVTKALLADCGPAIDFLETLGVVFEDYVGPDPQYTGLPVIHYCKGKGAGWAKPVTEAVQKRGAEILTSTAATEIVTDCTTGRVLGVKAIAGGNPIYVKSRKGVVVATGGYGANAHMVGMFSPMYAGMIGYTSPGNTGDGLVMGQSAGAFTTRTNQPSLMNSFNEKYGFVPDSLLQHGGILVGEDGKRFCNEEIGKVDLWFRGEWVNFKTRVDPLKGTQRYHPDWWSTIVRQIHKQKIKYVWMILVDSTELQNSTATGRYQANTIEELAKLVELDPAALAATIAHYNEMCQKGQDYEFGRSKDYLISLNKPPYYCHRIKEVIGAMTGGGLKVNTKAEVLGSRSLEGKDKIEAIPGLYAAGMAGGWNVAPGWTVISCFAQGRIAGKNAAALTPWG